jgi:hypothetical protein
MQEIRRRIARSGRVRRVMWEWYGVRVRVVEWEGWLRYRSEEKNAALLLGSGSAGCS